jgi:hypothetical protein
MNAPQIIMLLMLILWLIVVPPNDEANWKIRYCLGTRLARVALMFWLLWWGGFWGVGCG